MKREARAARRYAQALFAIALDRDALDQWRDELQRLATATDHPVALRLLNSPTAGLDAKRRAVRALAGSLSREVATLVDILLERKRAPLLVPLAEAFADCVREHRGIVRADVTTAVPLRDAERRMLADRLGSYLGRAVEMYTRVDPTIMGGVLARVGDRLLDGSIRGRLERLRRQLAGLTV